MYLFLKHDVLDLFGAIHKLRWQLKEGWAEVSQRSIWQHKSYLLKVSTKREEGFNSKKLFTWFLDGPLNKNNWGGFIRFSQVSVIENTCIHARLDTLIPWYVRIAMCKDKNVRPCIYFKFAELTILNCIFFLIVIKYA